MKTKIKYLFLLLICSISLSHGQSPEAALDGLWVSQSNTRMWEFDFANKLIMLENYKTNKIEAYKYEQRGDKYVLTSEEGLPVEIAIKELGEDRIQVRLIDLDVVVNLYRYHFGRTKKELLSSLDNSSFKLDSLGVIYFLLKNKEIYALNSGVSVLEKTWSVDSVYDVVILELNRNKFVVLSKDNNSYKLGDLSTDFRIINMEVNELAFGDEELIGSWKFEDRVYIKEFEVDVVLMLEIESKVKGKFHWKDSVLGETSLDVKIKEKAIENQYEILYNDKLMATLEVMYMDEENAFGEIELNRATGAYTSREIMLRKN
ncbi:MAG: hypothetical protein ACI9XB_003380 [Gammaproteobacteria bacterium]|jgi:hypothetical protein